MSHMFCPTCQIENRMRVGGLGHCDTCRLDSMYGQIGYECQVCKTLGVGPGTSPGLICSYGPATARAFIDGNKWCAVLPDFINLQESPTGFGDTRGDAVKELFDSLKPSTPPADAKNAGGEAATDLAAEMRRKSDEELLAISASEHSEWLLAARAKDWASAAKHAIPLDAANGELTRRAVSRNADRGIT